MKTRSWANATANQNIPSAKGFGLLQDAFFEDFSSGASIGPVALTLAMLKGMEQIRAQRGFRVTDEDGRILLASDGENITGFAELVALIQDMLIVSKSLYESYFERIRGILTEEITVAAAKK